MCIPNGELFPSYPSICLRFPSHCIWRIAQKEAITGEMASWVEYLLCKHEDLSLIPRIYVKTNKTDMVV